MRWQDWMAALAVLLSAGLQSSMASEVGIVPLLNLPMIAIALLSTYPRSNVHVLTVAVCLTRVAIGTESIPVTLFRSVLATYLSIKAGLSLMNHGWLLAVVTVSACVLIDIIAAIVAHPKYVGTMTLTEITVSVVFNAGITLLCAIPIEIYCRRRHIHGF